MGFRRLLLQPVLFMTLFALGTEVGTALGQEPTAGPSARPSLVQEVSFLQEKLLWNVSGRALLEDAAGGVLLEANDGRRWVIEANQVQSRRGTTAPFRPLTHDQLAEQMLAELPAGFRVHQTTHYVVCYNTSREYAQWTSALLERLYRVFTNFWRNQGVALVEPEFPLVVMVYATREQYAAASSDELGQFGGNVVGYYSLLSNRVSMYDLTESDIRRSGRVSLGEINQMLSQPAAVPLVATVVHEATHQIAFNCGLHQRLAELPLWLVEGMAMYFETPDLSSRRGWRGIGKVNYQRLETFERSLQQRGQVHVLALVAEDKPFRNPRTALEAYAQAWALTYFLLQYYPEDYVAYVQALAQREPLSSQTAEERRKEFRAHFGDPNALEQELVARMQRIDR